MKTLRISIATAVAFASLLAFSLPAPADASPLISIGDGPGFTSWQDAINAGLIQPATGLTDEENAFYGSQVSNYAYTPNMEVFNNLNVSDGTISRDALVMSWDPEPGTDLTIAAWEYVYDIDPDLTGTTIKLSLLAPTSIWDFSIELIDANNRVRAWFVDMSGITNNVWQNISLDPTQQIQPGFIPGTIQDPLFDITQVTKIRLDEAGMTSAILTPPPPGGTIVGQWNAWNSLQVVPEPSRVILSLVGIAAIGLRRRRG
ncbi:MAG: PEP-CTERM sorting domain-containing protein [Verrucomicrobiales bacterium]